MRIFAIAYTLLTFACSRNFVLYKTAEANLTCALDNKRLSVFAVFPLLQIFRYLTVHVHDDPSSFGNLY